MDSKHLANLEAGLLAFFPPLRSVAVALSGGVDSALVACAAYKSLGKAALAVTGDSPSVARKELEIAKTVAQRIGIRHHIIATDEFDNPDYQRNDGSRCYFCKSELYGRIQNLQSQLGFDYLCSGANKDDLGDYRPGLTAAAERGILHPLIEAGLGKSEVRALACHWDLPIWDKPASPCLSSRIAPMLEVTRERTGRIEQAEDFLKELGFPVCRVRYFPQDLARIEVPLENLARLEEVQEQVQRHFLGLGFQCVEIDPQGFRSGRLNDLIPLNQKQKYSPGPQSQREPSGKE